MASSDHTITLPGVTRRSMLTGAAALPVAVAAKAAPSGIVPDMGSAHTKPALPHPTQPPASPDADLFAAAVEVERQWQAHSEAYDAWSRAEPDAREWPPELEVSLSAVHAAVLDLAAIRARTLPGLLLKIRILAEDPEAILYGQAELMEGIVADLEQLIEQGMRHHGPCWGACS